MKRAQGFTLLELIIALAIFSIMSVMAYSGLKIVLDSRGITEQHSDRLSELQTAMLFMQHDLEQLFNRPVMDEGGTVHEALLGGSFGTYLMEFTRGGWQSPLPGTGTGGLQRVAYKFEEGALWRLSWLVLDGFGGEPLSRPLIAGLESVTARYMNASKEYVDSWPPVTASGSAGLPLAVEVTLEFKEMGKIRRVFRVAG